MLARSPGVVPHLSGGGCPPGLRRGLRRGRDQDQDEDQDQVPRAPASDPSQLTSGGNGGPGWQRRISSRVPRWVFFSRTGNFARTNFFLLFFVNVPRVGAVLLVCPRAPRGVVGVWRWSCGRDSSARSRSAGHGRGINCRPAQSPPLNTTRRPKAKAMTPCAVVVVVGGDAWARLVSRGRRQTPVADILCHLALTPLLWRWQVNWRRGAEAPSPPSLAVSRLVFSGIYTYCCELSFFKARSTLWTGVLITFNFSTTPCVTGHQGPKLVELSVVKWKWRPYYTV